MSHTDRHHVRNASGSCASRLATLLAGAFTVCTVHAEVIVVDGTPIQEAVDRASPGDTIFVKAAVYAGTPGSDALVTIEKDDITLVGSHGAIIDGTGFTYGVRVGALAPIGPDGCPPISVHGFRMEGLTVRNADFAGVQLIGVDSFRLADGVYLGNGEYGPFPICSTRGEIVGNFASGHEDASIYVGDDDGILVHDNTVSNNVIGIEVENSTNVVVRGNFASGNTAGVLVVVLPGLPFPYTDSVLIADNVITSNNLPNPIPPDSGDVIGLIPTGSGIVNVGGDRIVVRRNFITGNDSLGIGTIANFFFVDDPRIEPFVDQNHTTGNTITGNGAHPDPLRAFTPGADIIFIFHVIDPATGQLIAPDPDPSDNCYAGNEFGVDFPAGITAAFPCD